jgi:hypothetical protein
VVVSTLVAIMDVVYDALHALIGFSIEHAHGARSNNRLDG